MNKPYHAAQKKKLAVPKTANFKPNGGLKSKGKSMSKPKSGGAFKYHEGK